MLGLINDLIKSTKKDESDFYQKIVEGYISLFGYEYGLLISADSSGIPYLASSFVPREREAVVKSEYYINNYGSLLRSFSEDQIKDWPFSFKEEGSEFIVVFRCSFSGIMVLMKLPDDDVIKDIAGIAQFTGIVTGLLDLFNANRRSEGIIKECEEDSIRKSKYLTGFTNDLRTPLNAIAGFAQLLKEPDVREGNISKYVSIISDTSESIISKISSYSDIAEIENGSVKLINTEIQLNELIEEVCLRHNKKFLLKGLKLEYNKMGPESASAISGDEAKIRHILDVFLSNALQNTYSGKVTINCQIKGETVEFFVSDTGSGINDENRDMIFKYNEVQGSMILNSKGSGLGLLIAKSYARLMGGKIWFETDEGKGSSFFFTLPYSPVSETIKKINPVIVSEMNVTDAEKKMILVAEDDDLNFHLISTYLSNLNIEVIRAENGKDAVEIFKHGHIDLILMDIRMPVMDGFTAARLIREINADIKIIAQTAFSNDRSVAVSNGCNGFIAKPFSKNQLISLVTSYL